MEAIILALVPGLRDYPFLLNAAGLVFAFYFGGLIFSGFWNLLTGWKR